MRRGNPDVTVTGSGNATIIGSPGAQVSIVIGGEKRETPLEVATYDNSGLSPAMLLSARFGVVPFTGRQDVSGTLQRWLEDESAFKLYILGGAGGSGKTRIAAELCSFCSGFKWLAGFLKDSASTDLEAVESLAKIPTATLVVIDYAELRKDQLNYLLPLLKDHSSQEWPKRILLLVRRANPMQLSFESDPYKALLKPTGNARVNVFIADSKVLVLDDEPLDEKKRAALWGQAAEVFASRLTFPKAAHPAKGLLEYDIFTQPLPICIDAYLATVDTARGDRSVSSGISADELYGELLQREDQHWKRVAERSNLSFASDRHRPWLAAYCSLVSAGNETVAQQALFLAPNYASNDPAQRDAISQWAQQLYPGPRWWNTLQPDLVAEYLIAMIFDNNYVPVIRAFETLPAGDLANPLTLMGRTMKGHPMLRSKIGPELTSAVWPLYRAALRESDSADDDVRVLPDDRNQLLASLILLAPCLDPELDKLQALALSDTSIEGLSETVLSAFFTQQFVDHFRADEDLMRGDKRPLWVALIKLTGLQLQLGNVNDASTAILEARQLMVDAANEFFSAGDEFFSTRREIFSAREEIFSAAEVVVAREFLTDSQEILNDNLRALVLDFEVLYQQGKASEDLESGASGLIRTLWSAHSQYLRRGLETFRPVLAQALETLAKVQQALNHTDEAAATMLTASSFWDMAHEANPIFVREVCRSTASSTILAFYVHADDYPAYWLRSLEVTYRTLADGGSREVEYEFIEYLADFAGALFMAGEHEESTRLVDEGLKRRQRELLTSIAESDDSILLGQRARLLMTKGKILHSKSGYQQGLDMMAHAFAIFEDLTQRYPNLFREPSIEALGEWLLAAVEWKPDVRFAIDRLPEVASLMKVWGEQFSNSQRGRGYLAVVLTKLGRYLGQAGSHLEAITTLEEALVIWDELCARSPRAFLPRLAECMEEYADILALADRTDDSAEALRKAGQTWQAARKLTATPIEPFRLQ